MDPFPKGQHEDRTENPGPSRPPESAPSQQACWVLNAVWLDTKRFLESHNVLSKETTSRCHGSRE